MPTRPLGQRQRLVLLALDASSAETPETASELAARIAHRMHLRRPVTETENCQSALRSLERRGLVERLGVAAGGARTWTITAAGRAALDGIGHNPTRPWPELS